MFRPALFPILACLLSYVSPAGAATVSFWYDYVVTSVYAYDDSVAADYRVGDTGVFGFSYDTATRRVGAPFGGFVPDDVDSSASFDMRTLSLGLFQRSRGNWLVQSAGLSVGGGAYSVGFDPVLAYGFRLTNASIQVDGQLRALNGAVVPLPASAALLGSAALGALALRRRRR